MGLLKAIGTLLNGIELTYLVSCLSWSGVWSMNFVNRENKGRVLRS
jgi:hypothetical protein